MKNIRKLLFPFSILYGFITSIRNWLFDIGVLKSYSYNVPVIVVGNLSVGGTGKSPQVEYLIRLLSNNYNVATLSRGYKRKTTGFVLANNFSDAKQIGDEPFQYFSKFKNILVAVDESRKNGIENLLSQAQKPDVILLDDAFQHRKIKAGLYIILTTFADLYCDDYILPAGNLRESRSGAKRADIIIVTKCPKYLTTENQNSISNKLKLMKSQTLFFSKIEYDDCIYSKDESLQLVEIKNKDLLLVAGIANPKPFFDYLQQENSVQLSFADHHDFSDNEILQIKNKASNRLIITTEKDYVRLIGRFDAKEVFYLPIKTNFGNDRNKFDKYILDYVGRS